MFRLGYNTNGLAHHRVLDALRLLADLGYEGVALTPDVGGLDPLQLDRGLVENVRRWADELGLELAVETGARFVLDARRKHYPTLLEDEAGARARRVDFLLRSVELAAELGAGVVSVWSGAAPCGLVGDSREPVQDEAMHPLVLTDRFTAEVVELDATTARSFAAITIANELDVLRHAELTSADRVGILELFAGLRLYAPEMADIALGSGRQQAPRTRP